MSLDVAAGEIVAVIGPNGCGKSTLLRVIGGLLRPDAGTIELAGDAITAPDPRIGLVFQEPRLLPWRSVAENVAWPLELAGWPSDRAATRVGELIDLVGLEGSTDLRPVQLSGGLRQRAAIARALALAPDVLLLDEPFSALDPRRRALVRREVRAIHAEWGTTVLQVTHDFTEAGLLGDVAILLDAGRVLQYGAPEEVFRRPASPYVAEFLGAENVLAGVARTMGGGMPEWAVRDSTGEGARERDGRWRAIEFRTAGGLLVHAVGDAPDGPGHAVIRAEEVVLACAGTAGAAGPTSARNRFAGRVAEIAALGALTRVTLDIDGTPLVAALTTRSAQELGLTEGTDVIATFKAMAVHLC
jgi:molybdopterin-binding protein